jgi:hypothetical protein
MDSSRPATGPAIMWASSLVVLVCAATAASMAGSGLVCCSAYCSTLGLTIIGGYFTAIYAAKLYHWKSRSLW